MCCSNRNIPCLGVFQKRPQAHLVTNLSNLPGKPVTISVFSSIMFDCFIIWRQTAVKSAASCCFVPPHFNYHNNDYPGSFANWANVTEYTCTGHFLMRLYTIFCLKQTKSRGIFSCQNMTLIELRTRLHDSHTRITHLQSELMRQRK